MKVSIINIGNELLNGMILNTNAKFLSESLTDIGFKVVTVKSIGDEEESLSKEFLFSLENCDVVIVTGGLGPTIDDITKEVIANSLNRELIFDVDVMAKIEELFAKRNYVMTSNNKKQAYKIEGSTVINNNMGTAPGLRLSHNDKIIYILPGPPKELKNMFENNVKKELLTLTNNMIYSKMFRCVGIGESRLESLISNIIDNDIEYGIYANDSLVDIKLSINTSDENYALNTLLKYETRINEVIKDYMYSDGANLEQVVLDKLSEKNITLSMAESCTGGLLASTVVSVSGASKVLNESIVCYSNLSKINRLNVDESIINKYGAVSKECAEQMAKGVANTLNSDIGIAITGIAGPGGESDLKPVGLVYISTYYNGSIQTNEFMLNGDRDMIRKRATINALKMINDLVKKI